MEKVRIILLEVLRYELHLSVVIVFSVI